MWVVKLGGSLHGDPRLATWLRTLVDHGGGRVVVVPGGGAFADAVRDAQVRFGFDDLTAHNMAVLAMAQSAHLLRALEPRLVLAVSDGEIGATLREGRVALWMPYTALRETFDETTTWDVTSDSLALRLAVSLHAERLTVVKACAVEPGVSLDTLSARKVVDRCFATWARGVGFRIDVLSADSIDVVRWPWVTGPA